MDTGPNRKKRLILKEHEWELVRTFVKTYFEREDKAVAAKVTYVVLFSEIRKQYPDFDLEQSAFKKHVGRIEKWKAEVGIQSDHLGRDYLDRLKAVFLQVLIGLPLNTEFESIKFQELLQRAHQLEPDLKIIEKNRSTLAFHFRLKELKSLARGQRPAEATVSPGHRAAEAAQALAATAIDVPRHVEDGRFRAQKRLRRDKDVWEMSSDPTSTAHDEEEHSPRASEDSPPADQDAAIDLDIPAAGTQLAARDVPEMYGATTAGDGLSMLLENSSENLSKNAQKENLSSNAQTADPGQPDCSPATGDDNGTCLSCLIFGTFRY